jgi:flagellin
VPADQTELVINDPTDSTGVAKIILVNAGPGITGTDVMRAEINAATATHGLYAEIDHAGIFTIRTAVATDPGGSTLPGTPADLTTLTSNYEPVTRPASNPFVPAITVYDTSTATPEVLATDDASLSLSSGTLTIKSPQPSAMSITVGSENYHFTSSDNAQSIAQKINDGSGAADSGAGTSVHGTTATAQSNGTILFATYVAPEAAVPMTLVTTQADAHQTIRAIDVAIRDVNMQRSTLGAVSNRLAHTINNLTNISTNLSAAQGGIEDADFAFETTNLAKNQILQQASTAMLAQANASKQNVLSLLQG